MSKETKELIIIIVVFALLIASMVFIVNSPEFDGCSGGPSGGFGMIISNSQTTPS